MLNDLRDRQAKARIRKRLDRIELGNLGDVKSVGAGVLELRISYGPGCRVYFSQTDSQVVLLLCGGDKKTQDKDILRAKMKTSNENEVLFYLPITKTYLL